MIRIEYGDSLCSHARFVLKRRTKVHTGHEPEENELQRLSKLLEHIFAFL